MHLRTFKTRSSSCLIPVPSSAGFAKQQPMNLDGCLFKTLSYGNAKSLSSFSQLKKPVLRSSVYKYILWNECRRNKKLSGCTVYENDKLT